jgi:hypothetical protein
MSSSGSTLGRVGAAGSWGCARARRPPPRHGRCAAGCPPRWARRAAARRCSRCCDSVGSWLHGAHSFVSSRDRDRSPATSGIATGGAASANLAAMSDSPFLRLWPLQLLWVAVAVVSKRSPTAPTVEHGGGGAGRHRDAGGAAWFAALVAMLVPRTIGLTVVRLVVPAALAARGRRLVRRRRAPCRTRSPRSWRRSPRRGRADPVGYRCLRRRLLLPARASHRAADADAGWRWPCSRGQPPCPAPPPARCCWPSGRWLPVRPPLAVGWP